MSPGFHPHAHGRIALLEFQVKLLGRCAMKQASCAQFTGLSIHERNLLQARMMVASIGWVSIAIGDRRSHRGKSSFTVSTFC
jgi:hypothetical protein